MNLNNSEEKLIVPIDVQAMCIGKNETENVNKFSGNLYQFDLLKGHNQPTLSKDLIEGATNAMPFGIYIHWALPDGLTHAIQSEEDKEISFPPVPDLWCITRICENTPATIPTKTWMLESTYLSDEAIDINNSTPIPFNFDNATNPKDLIKHQGRVLSIDKWEAERKTNRLEANKYLNNISAIGYGVPEFAASYMHSKGVFGFYDDLKDIKNDSATFSYHVVGRYSKEDQDPLKQPQSNEDVLKKLKWSLPYGSSHANIDETILSGSISSIDWDTNKKYLSDFKKNQIEVSIGNTFSEAHSAMMANENNSSEKEVETILNTFQLGMLDEYMNKESINLLDNIHSSLNKDTFSAIDGGIEWIMEPIEKPKENENKSAKILLNDISENIAKDLDQLNKKQKKYTQLQNEIITRKQQLFLYWTKTQEENIDINLASDINNYLCTYDDDDITIKDGEIKKLQDKTGELKLLKGALKNEKDKIDENYKDFKLTTIPSSKYWIPKEPVILFKDNNRKVTSYPDRYGNDGRFLSKDHLFCRTTSQLIKSVNILEKDISIDATNLDINLPEHSFYEPYQQLLTDFLLLSIPYLKQELRKLKVNEKELNLSSAVANFIAPIITDIDQLKDTIKENDRISLEAYFSYKNNLTSNFKVKNDNKKIEKDLSYHAVSQSFQPSKEISFNGIAISPVGKNIWKENPWLPVYFSYKISHATAVPTSSYDVFLKDNFKLDKETYKLTPIVDEINSKKIDAYYKNYFLIDPQATENFKEQVKIYLENHTNTDGAYKILNELEESSEAMSPTISQSLFGFNDGFLTLKNTLQLQPFNLTPPPLLSKKIAKTIKEHIGDHNRYEIHNGHEKDYYPVTTGILKIEELKIIDTFGRHIKIPMEGKSIKIANSLKYKADNTKIYIAPRLGQPCKLDTSWIPANIPQIKTSNLPVTSPVIGWLMINPLDESIWFYDAKGTSLGAIFLSENKKEALWFATPDTENFIPDFEKFIKDSDCHEELKTILEFLFKNVDQLIKCIEESKSKASYNCTNKSTLNSNSLYIGTPMAIAKLSLSIELLGLPHIPYDDTSINDELDDDYNVFDPKTKFKRTKGLDKVLFPAYLGRYEHSNNGLLAYFKNNDIHYPSQDNDIHYPSQDNKTKVALSFSQAPLNITVIFDPQSKIHCNMGILPEKEIVLDPIFYIDIIKKMQLAILTAPIITNSNKIQFPLPDAPNAHQWNWLNTDGNNSWQSKQAVTNEYSGALKEGLNVLKEGWLKLNKDK